MNDVSLCRRVAAAMRGVTGSLGVDVCGCVKGNEQYFFLFRPAQRAEALEAVANCERNPQLSFGPKESCDLGMEIRRQEKAAQRAGGRLRGRG